MVRPTARAPTARTLDDPAELSGHSAEVARSFVRYLDQEGEEQADPISASARHARDEGWDYVEVVAPHDLHAEDPRRMADLLAEVAR